MRIKRRDFIKMSGLSLSALLLPAGISGCKETEASKPNILFLFSDDHAVQSIGAYGSRINKTPNIDRIANEGITLLRNTCCNSICAPSRAAILTGKHSHANGKMTNLDIFDGAQQTFPKILRENGYKTALIGKWHLKSDPTGFDYWDILPGQGYYYNPDFISQSGERRIEGYNTDIVTDLALEWMKKELKNDQPLMLMCQYKTPHRIWAPGPDHLTMYDDTNIPEPENLFDDFATRSSFVKDNEMMIADHLMYDYDLKIRGSKRKDKLGRAFENHEYARMTKSQKEKWDKAYDPKNKEFLKKDLKGKDLTRWKYQRYIKDYLRCIASLDDNIGRILKFLDDSGQAKNTLVIYSSDQGFYLGEHGWYDKRWIYEESLAMPFVARWPGIIKPGIKEKRLTQNIDFAPTFLDAADMDIPKDIQGKSLMPLFKGNTSANWRKSIYYHYYEEGEHNVPKHEGVRTEKYKLISFYGRNQWELYDLEKDPHEMKNKYNDPQYASIVKELKAELEELKKEYNVPAGIDREEKKT